MRNAASIARGAFSDTSAPSTELTSRLKLMSPRPIVTGSISARTRRTRSVAQPSAPRSSKRKPSRRSSGTAIASCTAVPASTPTA